MNTHVCLAFFAFAIAGEALRLSTKQADDTMSDDENLPSDLNRPAQRPQQKTEVVKKKSSQPKPPKREIVDEPELPAAFFYVVMDAVAGSHFMQVNVQSLREKGQFTGPIIFLTDHPTCLINTLGEGLLGTAEPVQYENNVTVFPGPVEGQSIHIKVVPPAHLTRQKMSFEQHKASARHHSKSAHLPYKEFTLIIMDDDILVAHNVYPFLKSLSHIRHPLATFEDLGPYERPNSPLLHDGRPNPNYVPSKEVRIQEQSMLDGTFEQQTYHCGMIVAKPGSEECLHMWYNVLVRRFGHEMNDTNKTNPNNKENKAQPDESDQTGKTFARTVTSSDAFSDVENQGDGQAAFEATMCAKKGKIALLETAKYFQWPQPSTLKTPPSQLKTFVHFTNSYRMRSLGGPKVEKYYAKIFNRSIDISHGTNHSDCPEKAIHHTYIR